jgi:short-subunit dehydrogenase
MKEYYLITGASSGLGTALAIELAKKNKNLILTGRNIQRLQLLKEQIRNVDVELFQADLRDETQCLNLISFIESKGIIVGFFNNAGLGYYKTFGEGDWGNLREVIDVNISSFTHMMFLVIQHMKKHRRPSRLVSIASMTSFLPLPHFAVYSASKLYVKRLHNIVEVELRGTPIRLHSVYPGGMHTGFMKASNQTLSEKASKTLMAPEVVARDMILSIERGKKVIVPGFENKLLKLISSFFTESFLTKVIGKVTSNFIRSST